MRLMSIRAFSCGETTAIPRLGAVGSDLLRHAEMTTVDGSSGEIWQLELVQYTDGLETSMRRVHASDPSGIERLLSGLAQASNFWCPFAAPLALLAGSKSRYVRQSAAQALVLQLCYLSLFTLLAMIIWVWRDMPLLLFAVPSILFGLYQFVVTFAGLYSSIVGRPIRYPVIYHLLLHWSKARSWLEGAQL